MNLKDLIPKHKFDIETAELLFDYSFDEIEPILPQLLEWLQDGNWPVSRPVARYMNTLPQDKLGPYLVEILSGEDYDWQYFLLCGFEGDVQSLHPQFLAQLKRLSENPTQVEINLDLQWIANQILGVDGR